MVDCIGIAVGILTDELDVPVSTEIPDGRPDRFVLVSLDGDSSTEFVLRQRLALTCWGQTDRDAMGIAVSALHALQDAATDHALLSAAELESMSRDEWTRTGKGRYVALVTLTVNTEE